MQLTPVLDLLEEIQIRFSESQLFHSKIFSVARKVDKKVANLFSSPKSSHPKKPV